jgi:cytochrome c oxidase subunit II
VGIVAGRVGPMKQRLLRAMAGATLLSAGCGGRQSIMDSANPAAREIEALWWVSLASTGTLCLLVIGALLWAVLRARRSHGEPAPDPSIPSPEDQRREDRWVLVLGALLPGLFLVGFLVLAVRTGFSVAEPFSEPTLTVEVAGHKFWWEITYPEHGVVTANELHIPVGEPVEIRVTSADVIHSFWVPKLSPGKVDMVPGRTNVIWMSADEPGEYRGQCTEFCGVQHALMSMLVVASEPDEFDAWIAARTRPLELPDEPELERGLAVFTEAGCQACHAIDGRVRTSITGAPGPDLFALSRRRTLGALALEYSRDNLADWILDPHEFKPGVRMPAHRLNEEDLSALVSYLESLGR